MSMEVRLNTHGPGKLQTLAMTSDEAGFNVVSTLIFGEKDAVLVDCQWTRSNAYRVIAEICERNLNLVLQCRELCQRVLVCVNLMDEAERRGIRVDCGKLSEELGLPVIGIVARRRESRWTS